MTTLADMQKRATALSDARDKLSQLLLTLQQNLDVVKNGSLAEIKKVSRQVAREHTELQALIASNPELFASPRTFVVDGVKFGMHRNPGTLEWESDEKVCARIRTLVDADVLTAEQAELLITTTEKPVVKALAQLEPQILKRIGVTSSGPEDKPLIKSVDGAVEKAVNAVIKDAIKDATAEEAA